jgi:hypothetical protein
MLDGEDHDAVSNHEEDRRHLVAIRLAVIASLSAGLIQWIVGHAYLFILEHLQIHIGWVP